MQSEASKAHRTDASSRIARSALPARSFLPSYSLTYAVIVMKASGMSANHFGRFAPETINALIVAQQHVVARGGQGLAPEHLLLAFLDPPGEPMRDHLDALGFAVDRASAIIDSHLPHHDPPYEGEVSLTLPTKYAIAVAVDEFRAEGTAWLDNRHLLLGILRQSDNPILAALQHNGLDLLLLQDQLRALPPSTKGLLPPYALLRASPRFTILAVSGLLTLATLTRPLSGLLANTLPYAIAIVAWLVVASLLKHSEAGDRYRRGERGAHLRSLQTLDIRPTPALLLSLLLPLILLFLVRHA